MELPDTIIRQPVMHWKNDILFRIPDPMSSWRQILTVWLLRPPAACCICMWIMPFTGST